MSRRIGRISFLCTGADEQLTAVRESGTRLIMSYELGLRNDGWLVVDVSARRVAEFGGIELGGLSNEEAETMRGLLLHHDRALEAMTRFATATEPGAVEAQQPSV